MKTSLIAIFCFIILSGAQCKKEGNDCHYEITIRNNTGKNVIGAHKFFANNKCVLDGQVISSNGNYKESSRICWERKISDITPYELFIIDISNYNNPNVFYSCDSIEYYNTILAHYILNLEDLKSTNFTITYP